MFVEYQPGEPQHPRLEHRGQDGLHHRLPGLEVLAADRQALRLRRARSSAGMSTVRFGAPLAKGTSSISAAQRVQHRRRDGRVVLLHRLLERRQRLVRGPGRDEHLGRRAPHEHQPVTPRPLLERADVLAQLLGEVALRLAALDVGALQPLHVVLVERRGHRGDALQEIGDRLEMLATPARRPWSPPCTRCRESGPRRRTRGPSDRPAARTPGSSGARRSVRLPRRIVPIWVSDPIGRPLPRRTVSTPAMKVVATAPSPTSSTPSFPCAGAISRRACSGTISVLSEVARGQAVCPGGATSARAASQPTRGRHARFVGSR